LRRYLFTDRDRERLRAWLESGEEDDGTRMLFVGVRRNLNRIAGDAGLLSDVSRRLVRLFVFLARRWQVILVFPGDDDFQ
jgi:hypothetical protein